MPDAVTLAVAVVVLVLSLGQLYWTRRALRTWRAAATGWERSAARWRDIAEKRGALLDELLGHRP